MIFINLVERGKTAEPSLAVSLLVSRHDNMFSLLGGFDWAALRTHYSILFSSLLLSRVMPSVGSFKMKFIIEFKSQWRIRTKLKEKGLIGMEFGIELKSNYRI